MPNDLQQLRERHHRIVDLCLDGFTNTQIAQELQMAPQSISTIKLSPIFQAELSRRRGIKEVTDDSLRYNKVAQAKEKLDEISLQAVEVHQEMMVQEKDEITGKNVFSHGDATALSSAKNVLDKTFGKDKEVGVSQVLNIESIKILQVALTESRG